MENEIMSDYECKWLSQWMPQLDNQTLRVFAMLNHHYLRKDVVVNNDDEQLNNNIFMMYYTSNSLILEKLIAIVQGAVQVNRDSEIDQSEVFLLPFNSSNTWQRDQVDCMNNMEQDNSSSGLFRLVIKAQFRLVIDNKFAGMQYILGEGTTVLVRLPRIRLIGQRGTCETCVEMKRDVQLTVIELTHGLAKLTVEQDDLKIESQPGNEIVFLIHYATRSIIQSNETPHLQFISSSPPLFPNVITIIEKSEPTSEESKEPKCINKVEHIKECEKFKSEQTQESPVSKSNEISKVMENKNQLQDKQNNLGEIQSPKVNEELKKSQENIQMRRVDDMNELRDIMRQSKPVIVCKVILKSNVKQLSITQNTKKSKSKDQSKSKVVSKKSANSEISDSSEERVKSLSRSSKKYRFLELLKNDAINSIHNSYRYLKVGSKFVKEYKYRYQRDHNVKTKFHKYYKKLREQLFKTINLMENYFGQVCDEYSDDKDIFYDKMEEITKLVGSPNFKNFPRKARMINRHLHDISRMFFK